MTVLTPCVNLPSDWHPNTLQPHPLPTCVDDHRHFVRFHFRVEAEIETIATLPSVAREARRHTVFTKDVSREGIAFYHGVQLFPFELIKLSLPGTEPRLVRVRRCHRVQDHCFEIGAQFA